MSKSKCALSFILLLASALNQAAIAQVFNDIGGPQKFKRPTEIKLTDDAPQRSLGPPTLKDVFPFMNLPFTAPQPLSLEGMKLSGLGARSSKILGFNHFVVLQGTPGFNGSSALLFKDNRENNRSNFITVDPFVHAYFVFSNTLALRVINETLYSELNTLLLALVDSCVKDYRACEIDEVKDDIQRNLAFVIVGLKLLDPKIVLADMGGASDLAQAELAIIAKGKRGRSVIFNREQDYSALSPIGFYASSERSANYFRSAAWLSCMYLTLSDVTIDSRAGGGNNFRRALLLYRAIELGRGNRIKSVPGIISPSISSDRSNSLMASWQRIYDISVALAPSVITREQTVYPREIKSMFQAGNLEFKDLLQTLAQPLSRARLLLSIKKQRPQGLDAASIFEMDKNRNANENLMVMRFLPPVNSYELEWMKWQTTEFKEEGEDGLLDPLSLYLLYSWGSPVASNILNTLTDRLDPNLINTVPELTRVAGRRRIDADPTSAACLAEKRWAIITEYFRPMKKNSQTCLMSENWSIQHLLSASGAFVDSFSAYDRPVTSAASSSTISTGPKLTETASKVEAVNSIGPANKIEPVEKPSGVLSRNEMNDAQRMFAPKQSVKKAANFHYLEPMPELYAKLSWFTQTMAADLTRLKCFPEDLRSRQSDFVRLLDRLTKISEQELAVQPISVTDFKLLANVDQILAVICPPESASIFVPGAGGGGASIGPGDSGHVYAIFSTDQGPYLSRGSTYTYFETAGGPFKQQHWDRKQGFGFLRPPSWVSKVDIVSDASPDAKSVSKPDAKPVDKAVKVPAQPSATSIAAPSIVKPSLVPSVKPSAPQISK
ncbi:DUF3160 domain-containing protein [bacterium]|nr:DUF3160 domain-containing protein [bacterium]MBP9810863.1 DUF3160 domain-containing protein [bacterium]